MENKEVHRLRIFENRSKAMLLVQLILGIAGILFIITGWIKDFQPGYILAGIIILAVMMVMNGLEQYILSGKKSYLLFTIVVAAAFMLFWLWRFQAAG
jgi:hypothetical protein